MSEAQYGATADKYARLYGLDPALFRRVVAQESGWNIGAKSPVGASGLSQIMPATGRDPGYGVTPLAAGAGPEENLRFGAEYLASQIRDQGGDVTRGLQAYNWGPGNLQNWDGNPANMPDETRMYTANILSNAGPSQQQGNNMAGLLGPAPQQEQREPGALERMTGGFMTPDRVDRAIIAMQGMTMNPNEALARSAQANISRRADSRATQEQANKTAQWLAANGQDQLAAAVAGGHVDPKTAASMGLRNVSDVSNPSVQSSSLLPDMSGSVITMRDGSLVVRKVDGSILNGQEAVDFVAKSQEIAAGLERDIYSARRTGTNTAEADTGAAAAAAGAAGEQAIKAAGDAWTAYGNLNTSIGTIDEAIAALDAGARSGAMDRYLPNITEASASLKNAMDRMGLDVIASVTFGALSQAEMTLAMETAVPRNLDEPQLKAWLIKRRNAQQNVMAMLADAADFLGTPGNTLNDWVKKNKAAGSSTASANETLRENVESGTLSPAAQEFMKPPSEMTDDELLKSLGVN